jgi:hypothetical protein
MDVLVVAVARRGLVDPLLTLLGDASSSHVRCLTPDVAGVAMS